MQGVDGGVDQSTKGAIERQRAAEAARKERIFNTRSRVMGLDLAALDQQVLEKKQQQDMERERDKAFDTLRMNYDKILLQKDIEEREMRAALNADLTHYWAVHQRTKDSQNADLRCGLRGALRASFAESELGPASMQIFQGEDNGAKQRKREQMNQLEKFLGAQKLENGRRQMRDKHKEMLAQEEQLNRDLQWRRQHALEEDHKRTARVTLDDYNRALAEEQAEERKEQRRREEKESLAEMLLTSKMMTECSEAAERPAGGGRPPRVLVDRWKGMSPEQLSAVHRERRAQCSERQKQHAAEKRQEAMWDLQLLKGLQEAEKEERRSAKVRRERRIQTDRFNVQLAEEQRAHQQYLNKKLYTNKPTMDYFNQFNTSSR